MAVDFDDLLAHVRRAEFILFLISTGDAEAMTYAGSVAADLRKVIKEAGAEPVPNPARKSAKIGSRLGARKGTRKEPTYWEDVRTIAEDIKENCPDPRRDSDCRSERIHEDVDGSSWIIYYSENEEVLKHTNNTPDDSDVRAMTSPDADWKQMRTIAAFLAMEADVWEVLREIDEDTEE